MSKIPQSRVAVNPIREISSRLMELIRLAETKLISANLGVVSKERSHHSRRPGRRRDDTRGSECLLPDSADAGVGLHHQNVSVDEGAGVAVAHPAGGVCVVSASTVLEQRLAMLSNGYEPIPVSGKKPGLEGWTSRPLDADTVRQHVAELPMHTNTGIRTGASALST